VIREATAADEEQVLAACTAWPANGTLCEMYWHLWRENARMPHRFFLIDKHSLLQLSGSRGILCGPVIDDEELVSFLQLCGINQLTTTGHIPAGWHLAETGHILQFSSALATASPPIPSAIGFYAPQEEGKAKPPIAALAYLDEEPPINDVLAVLESNRGRMQPENIRESFWVDSLIRRNHGVARIVGIRQNGVLQSTAGAYAITSHTAYIACVETRPNAQKQGYAQILLQHLCHTLAPRAITLSCTEALIPFYRQLGFALTEFYALTVTAPSQP